MNLLPKSNRKSYPYINLINTYLCESGYTFTNENKQVRIGWTWKMIQVARHQKYPNGYRLCEK